VAVDEYLIGYGPVVSDRGHVLPYRRMGLFADGFEPPLAR